MKDGIRKVIRELSICTSPETADRENVKACRFLLAMFTAACASAVLLQLLFFGRLHNQAFMQGFIGFVFLDLIYIVYHDVIDRKPALSTEIAGLLIITLLSFIETVVFPDRHVFAVFLFIIAIPLLILDKPWKLCVFILLGSFILVCFDAAHSVPETFRENTVHLSMVIIVALVLSVSIVRRRVICASNIEKTLERAERDALTGIYNRGGGTFLIRSYVGQQYSGTFLIIDVDDFKTVNDRYGHQMGDEVLEQVAGVLRNSFQKSDIVMRMGGDEFMVYAIGMVDYHTVEARLDKVIQEMHRIMLDEKKGIHITVSIGCAVNDGSYTEYDALYEEADRCLYRVKENGKDSYFVYNAGYKGHSKANKTH